ncbi:Phosphatidylglycerol--prolipoprotein diacylglyceryl transferase, partial [Dissostichus eleginoides]
ILQRLPSKAEMRRTDERRGSGETKIDQNQTGVQSTGGHKEGRNAGPSDSLHAVGLSVAEWLSILSPSSSCILFFKASRSSAFYL